MGAGSSNNVKNIQIDPETDKKSSKGKHQQLAPKTDKDVPVQKFEAPGSTKEDSVTEIDKLTQQLCESESQRLDLEDRVQALEEELERVNAQTVAAEDKPCDETLQAKDHYIAKVEKEKKDAELELHKMRVRHRKKVKQLTTQMAEYKQEVNFQMMELKDEIKRLQNEIKGKGSASNMNFPEIDDKPKLPGGEKMKLILELSEQVTEQQDKIAALERQLSDKDQTVQELRAKLKNNSEYLKALNGDKSSKGSVSENNSSLNRSLSCNNASVKYTSKKSKEAARMKSLAQEDSDEGSNLLKLSSLLQGVKVDKNKTRHYDEVLVEEDIDGSGFNQGNVLVDEGEIGTGRDSGLGSAGKREEEQIRNENKLHSLLSDWRDSGSGLSDSDLECDTNSGSKIMSAPPALQNSGRGKQKKKSNSLKKRVPSNERPPRPGMAFMNSVVEETTLTSNQNLSPVISPVQVS